MYLSVKCSKKEIMIMDFGGILNPAVASQPYPEKCFTAGSERYFLCSAKSGTKTWALSSQKGSLPGH